MVFLCAGFFYALKEGVLTMKNLVVCSVFVFCSVANATTVDYFTFSIQSGDFSTPSLDYGGIT